MLVRAMEFRGYVVSSVIGTLVGATVGTVLAAMGAGVWALVGFALTEAFIATAAGWILAIRADIWRPGIAFDPRALRGLFAYSSAVTGSRLLTYAATNTDNLIVGRVLGATSLGYYGLAYRLMLVPIQRIGDVIAIAVFPAFARAQDDRAKLRVGFLRGVRYLSVICLPVTLGTAAAASIVVPVLFGRAWMPAVPSVQILCLSGPAIVLMRLATTLLEGIGRAKTSLYLIAALLAILIPGFLISVHHGITGVAWTVTIGTYTVLVPALALAGRQVNASVVDQILNVVPVLIAVAAMVVAIAATRIVFSAPSLVDLSAVVVVAVSSYAGVLCALQPRLLREMARALLSR
jgi:PST family polysaccharide transporter